MEDKELRARLFDLITDPPCYKCEFWDKDGHYCFLEDMHRPTAECKLLNKIDALYAEEVKL